MKILPVGEKLLNARFAYFTYAASLNLINFSSGFLSKKAVSFRSMLFHLSFFYSSLGKLLVIDEFSTTS